jgi:hypothetical protein
MAGVPLAGEGGVGFAATGIQFSCGSEFCNCDGKTTALIIIGYPDITFMLHRADPTSPYPSQIGFRDAHDPDDEQFASLHKGTNEIIKLYCPPGTQNPYPSSKPLAHWLL